MDKQKAKEQKVYDCKDCINSLLIKQLNCKLKMFDDDIENKYTKVDKVIDCLWFKGYKMKRKLELNQCTKCKRTYDLKVVNATADTCASCNEKKRDKVREKDSLRKTLNRSDNNLPCSNIEKLGEYCE